MPSDANVAWMGAGPKIRPHEPVPHDVHQKGALAIMIGVPCLLFFVVHLLFLYVYYFLPYTINMIWGLLMTFAVGGFVLSLNIRWLTRLFLMCILSLLWGGFCGIQNYETHVREYHFIEDQAMYHNVLPGEPAPGRRDASVIYFANTAKSYGTLGAGFKHRDMYCAAPIMDYYATGEENAYYWAIGKNCCLQSGEFWCGAAKFDKQYIGFRGPAGVVLEEVEDNFWSSVVWDDRKYFHLAVNQSAARHNLNVDRPMLVHYVEFAHEYQEQVWINALYEVFYTCCLAFTVFAVVGFVLHYAAVRRLPSEAKSNWWSPYSMP
mmetsp:Transcript_9904/g.21768  ORF Transcript_9904/g.21768 Transcript_9904/m.21768 type:complete len:320 (+) Transcript_9904:155-1114(+)